MDSSKEKSQPQDEICRAAKEILSRAAPTRKAWEWNADARVWELTVGILSFRVEGHAGRWFVHRLGVRGATSHATLREAFDEAEERAFITGMQILLELPGS